EGALVLTRLVVEQRVVHLPEESLIVRAPRGFSRFPRLGAEERVVAILEIDLTGRDEIPNELRFDHTGELTAAWSLEVAKLDDRHRRVGVALEAPFGRYLDRRRWRRDHGRVSLRAFALAAEQEEQPGDDHRCPGNAPDDREHALAFGLSRLDDALRAAALGAGLRSLLAFPPPALVSTRHRNPSSTRHTRRVSGHIASIDADSIAYHADPADGDSAHTRS